VAICADEDFDAGVSTTGGCSAAATQAIEEIRMEASRRLPIAILSIALSAIALSLAPTVDGEAGQVDNAMWAYAFLVGIADHLTQAVGADGGPSGRANQARQDVEWLARSLTSQAPGPPSPQGSVNQQMIRGLQADDDALVAAASSETQRRKALLDSVYEDLHLKFLYCKMSPDRMNAMVDISVQTWDNDKEVKSWQVASINAPLAILHSDRYQAFPKFSSPTKTRLPPGRYLIWAQDPKNPSRRGPAKEISLGNDGVKSLDADVLIPRP
jgi:hypothetical protein